MIYIHKICEQFYNQSKGKEEEILNRDVERFRIFVINIHFTIAKKQFNNFVVPMPVILLFESTSFNIFKDDNLWKAMPSVRSVKLFQSIFLFKKYLWKDSSLNCQIVDATIV